MRMPVRFLALALSTVTSGCRLSHSHIPREPRRRMTQHRILTDALHCSQEPALHRYGRMTVCVNSRIYAMEPPFATPDLIR